MNRKLFTLKQGITRQDRVLSYLKELDDSNNMPISNKKMAILRELFRLVEERAKRVKLMSAIQTVCYLGIYFTFISLIFQEFVIFKYIGTIIGAIISGFGTSIFFIGVFITTQLKQLYYEDISLLSSHIISLYSTIDYTLMPEDAENVYKKFLEYFHKRLEID